jgi:hypothetical protein
MVMVVWWRVEMESGVWYLLFMETPLDPGSDGQTNKHRFFSLCLPIIKIGVQ